MNAHQSRPVQLNPLLMFLVEYGIEACPWLWREVECSFSVVAIRQGRLIEAQTRESGLGRAHGPAVQQPGANQRVLDLWFIA